MYLKFHFPQEISELVTCNEYTRDLKCIFTSWRKFHNYFTFQKPRGRGAGSAGSGNNNNNNNSLQAPGQTTTPTPLSKNDNNSTVTKMDTSPIPPGNRNLNVSLF